MGKFLKEILEQPVALQKTLDFYTGGEGKKTLQIVKNELTKRKLHQIIFTGMGSSNFISQTAATLLNDMSFGIKAFAVNASELLHYQMHLLQQDTALICVSQSGESYEIIQILNKLPAGVFCIGITNESGSTLAKKADISLLSIAGLEEMTSTKTYVSTLMISFLMALELTGQFTGDIKNQIGQTIKNIAAYLDDYQNNAQAMINFLGDLPALTVVARGPAVATAHQTALMFKEAVKVPAFSMLGGEFRHGPMEMVQQNTKVIMLAPQGRTYNQNIKMAEDIARFGGKVLLLTNTGYQPDSDAVFVQKIATQNEALFALESIIPMQVFIDLYAKNKGFYAGSFSHGAKVTTIE